MNINVKTLQEQIQTHRDRVEKDRLRWESNVSAAERDFTEKYGDKASWIEEWREYRNRVNAELRKADPDFAIEQPRVTLPTFNRGRWRKNYNKQMTWDNASHGYGPPPSVDIEVESLAAFLSTVDDVTISTSALTTAGFRNFKNLYGILEPKA